MNEFNVKPKTEEATTNLTKKSYQSAKKPWFLIGIGIAGIVFLLSCIIWSAFSPKESSESLVIVTREDLAQYNSSKYTYDFIDYVMHTGEVFDSLDYSTWWRSARLGAHKYDGYINEDSETNNIATTDYKMYISFEFNNPNNELSSVYISPIASRTGLNNTFGMILIDENNNYTYEGRKVREKNDGYELVKKQVFSSKSEFIQFINYLSASV